MTHHKGSKCERVTVKITDSSKELLNLLSNKDGTKISQACLFDLFYKYGVYVAFTEFIEDDLSNLDLMLKSFKKLVESRTFQIRINSIVDRNKLKGGLKKNEKE